MNSKISDAIFSFVFGAALALVTIGIVLFFVLFNAGVNIYYTIVSSLVVVMFGSLILLVIESIYTKNKILKELKSITDKLENSKT